MMGCVFRCEFERGLLYSKFFIGGYEYFIFLFLVRTWCKQWVIVSILDNEDWGGVVILHI